MQRRWRRPAASSLNGTGRYAAPAAVAADFSLSGALAFVALCQARPLLD